LENTGKRLGPFLQMARLRRIEWAKASAFGSRPVALTIK
jgi:hypothetical protein